MVYLIHFDEPLEHARHYLGYTKDFAKRMEKHRSGTGAAILAELKRRGIGYKVVWIWPDGDQEFERKLKNRHDTPSLCPICNPKPVRYGRMAKNRGVGGQAYSGQS